MFNNTRQTISKTMSNIEQIVDNFIPIESEVDEKTKQKRKKYSGKNTYNK